MAACFPFERLAPADRAVADSLLAHALDHEALYTLAAPLKPMSSVGMLTLRIAPPDSIETPPDAFPTEAALARVAQWHRIAEVFRCGTAEAVLVPYRNAYDGVRYLQLTVVDRPRVHALMDATADVWAHWGVSGEAAPSVIVGAVEHAEPYRRFRGYGLLFGYPGYAIDFFVAAAEEADRTDQFVTRDFFHIPVHAAERGYFTYAIPKGHTPTAVDSARYHTAMNVLSAYRDRRPAHLNPDSTLDALGLLRDWRSQGLPLIQTPSL
ncbi:MAG: hypothetical protein AAF730_09790 [Bacteroidota bacterium]